ncbi:CPBP family intramembrane glutamic endopeptidase [Sedimentibacter sp.]|uniref:CPBP family intramembrane glutamic endopeptidase n=1 Tax=Sedimentibacter sp. TaxID=1960295 RepID=UPI000EBAD0E5|nr:CPBP family intramembrane glutamic endopeptidase [Sedimentibacter sp.]HCX62284.1 CPBP family intramembrane metalloprotease [Clostridiales bacterium]
MDNDKRKIAISGIMIIACILMYMVETIIKPVYAIKSIYKIIIFAGLPLVYCAFDKEVRFKEYFRINDKKQIKFAVALGLGVYLLIQAGYYILKGFIDLDNISMNLENNLSVNKDNFIFVSLYISFINSLLEELFFRGFGFVTLCKFSSKRYTYIISSLAFSVYHVSILANWFNIIIYVLFITGLFVTGLFFNRLNDRYNNIFNSWIVHMCANFSINTIGFMMFGII